jgi:hypothetical protein
MQIMKGRIRSIAEPGFGLIAIITVQDYEGLKAKCFAGIDGLSDNLNIDVAEILKLNHSLDIVDDYTGGPVMS